MSSGRPSREDPAATAPSIGDAPRLSVVVPVYDVAAYLPACLPSIAGQPVRDHEVIVVDDGSPDDSATSSSRPCAAIPGSAWSARRTPVSGLRATSGVRRARGHVPGVRRQ